MNSEQIIKLLAVKHDADVFVPECKDGPSQSGSHSRLDAWAMARSWSNASVKGYEVKVSRSDFIRDDKWRNYLPLCNQLYFVCPTGIISPSELPAEVGLIWASKTGTRLYEKKKAAFREVVIPENLYRYVLMCRTVVTRDNYGARIDADQATYWRDWMAKKEDERELGRAVAGTVSKMIMTKAAQAEHTLRTAEQKMKEYDKIRETITSMGLDPDCFSSWGVKRHVESLLAAVPDDVMHTLDHAQETLKRVTEKLARLRETSSPNPNRTDAA
jgi:hypothetical protein